MIAAPVGPVGLLCIRRTLQKGLLIGFATGFGAACADALFGAIAVLGVVAIFDFIRHFDISIRILGGVFLLVSAWHTWRDHPRPSAESSALVEKIIGSTNGHIVRGVIKACLSAFAITLTNPVTIFAVLAVVATFGHVENRLSAATMVSGIFTGSTLWWFLLSGGITLVRGHFTENGILIVNRVTASVLAVLAVWAGLSGGQELALKLGWHP